MLKMLLRPKTKTGCNGLPGSDLKDGGVPPEYRNVAVLFVIIPAHYLFIMEICDSIQIKKHKIHPKGMATLRKYICLESGFKKPKKT